MNDEKELTHIDLFSGIGGFTLAGEWAGFRTVVFCEKEEFCQKVLKARFGGIVVDSLGNQHKREKPKSPKEEKGIQEINRTENDSPRKFSRANQIWGSNKRYVPIIPEIRDFDGTKWRGATLLTGGFPCQPFSVAGPRTGTKDDRYLWPEMFRIIKEAKPRWVLAENVTGIVKLALGEVLSDLESIGYDFPRDHEGTPIVPVIPACSLNAPHRRYRVWIVAYDTRSKEPGRISSCKREKISKIGQTNNHAQNARCEHGKGTEDKGESGRPLFDKENAPLFERPTEDDELGDTQNSIRPGARNQNRKIDDQEGQVGKDRREGIQQKDRAIGTSRATSTNKYASDSTGKREKSISQQRQGSGIKSANSHAPDSDTGRNGRYECKSTEKGSITCSSWQEDWHEIATRFCRVDDGIPDRLDGFISQDEALRAMWEFYDSAALGERKVGCNICEEEILLKHLLWAMDRIADIKSKEKCYAKEGKEKDKPNSDLRKMQFKESTTMSSQRSEYREQFIKELGSSLSGLSSQRTHERPKLGSRGNEEEVQTNINPTKNRIGRLKALGNAIVPQIAYEILKYIAWIERNR